MTAPDIIEVTTFDVWLIWYEIGYKKTKKKEN